jgi:GrpB-like predicted nucleotidyltransferase (UPF0157 family)
MSEQDHKKDPLRKNTTSKEYLIGVTIGELEPLDNTINLVSYDPDWPAQFARHASRIREALSEKGLLLEHVGSTSVPGLTAKPVVDMILAVSDSADELSYIPPLEQQGYVLRIREPDWFEHHMLTTARSDVNLHVFSAGCEEIDRMIAFRNWLRTHKGDRILYEKTKLKLAAQRWKYVQDYADAKSEVVKTILARAMGS